MATFPANIIRSAQLIQWKYLRFIGHNMYRNALSKLVLSGHEFNGGNRIEPLLAPPRPSYVRYVPAECHARRTSNGP